MSEEIKKVVETEEVVSDAEVEKVCESKAKGFISKVGAGFKKHGKKIAAGAVVLGIGAVGFALGKKRSGCDDCDFEPAGFDDPADDVDDSDVELNEE